MNTETMTKLGTSQTPIGAYPKRKNTARAATLAHLLSGASMSSPDAIHRAGTIRLPTAISDLRHKYSWPIVTYKLPLARIGGRLVTVTRYALPRNVIDAATALGAGSWVDEVLALRKAMLNAKETT